MRPADRLAAKLAAGEVILLDGATGTELQRRGVPMDGEAWCALATLTHPDVLRAVHEDYVRLGCDVVTANTFANARHMMARAGRGADTRLTYLSGGGTLLGSGALGDYGVRLALRRPRASAPGRRNGRMLSFPPNAPPPPPAPRRPCAPRSPAPASPPACWPGATGSAPRPSASGASAGRLRAGIAPAAHASCPGRRARRSGRSCASCVGRPASRWTTSPSWSGTSSRTSTGTTSTASSGRRP